MAPGQPNVGLKMTAEAVADGILERQAPDEKIDYSVIDPAAFSEDGGPSIGERMAKRGVYFQRADNSRVGKRGATGGWDMVRSRLVGEDERPMIYFFDTCVHIIRTLPALQHDEHNAEDVDSRGEDHAPDALRYGLMARPITRSEPQSGKPKYGTVDWLMSETGEEKARSKYRR